MRTSKVVVVLSLIFLSKAEARKTNNRRKRGNQDNFNILLNMYKMNPLRHSNVFKTFSNQVLLPRPEFADLNLNTKESINERQNRIDIKKQYRELIDYSPNKPNKSYLNVEDLIAESLNAGHDDNLLSFNEINFDEKSNGNDDADIFGNTFVVPKTAKQRIKENIRDKVDRANTIDLDPNMYILRRKHKNIKKHDHPDIVLA